MPKFIAILNPTSMEKGFRSGFVLIYSISLILFGLLVWAEENVGLLIVDWNMDDQV